MTKEEVYKKLDRTKLYVGNYSKEIQEKLFRLGYSWAGIKEIKYLDKPFMFINPKENLSWDDEWNYFKDHPYKEITFKDILDLKEEFLPFRNKQELLKEMFCQPSSIKKVNSLYIYDAKLEQAIVDIQSNLLLSKHKRFVAGKRSCYLF